MQARIWQGRIWGAWLGLLALALNALVPIHLAFDLADAAGAAQHSTHEQVGGAERQLLALISGHREARGHADEHGSRHRHGHHHGCPVCSALGALAGLAPPALVVLSAPLPGTLPAPTPLVQSKAAGAPAGYRSRAPPIA